MKPGCLLCPGCMASSILAISCNGCSVLQQQVGVKQSVAYFCHASHTQPGLATTTWKHVLNGTLTIKNIEARHQTLLHLVTCIGVNGNTNFCSNAVWFKACWLPRSMVVQQSHTNPSCAASLGHPTCAPCHCPVYVQHTVCLTLPRWSATHCPGPCALQQTEQAVKHCTSLAN